MSSKVSISPARRGLIPQDKLTPDCIKKVNLKIENLRRGLVSLGNTVESLAVEISKLSEMVIEETDDEDPAPQPRIPSSEREVGILDAPERNVTEFIEAALKAGIGEADIKARLVKLKIEVLRSECDKFNIGYRLKNGEGRLVDKIFKHAVESGEEVLEEPKADDDGGSED